MLNLPVKEVLINARKAFDEGKLQIQKAENGIIESCLYAGPCAIGISVPTELALKWDGPDGDSSSIHGLFERGEVKTDNIYDLIRLQDAHDFGVLHAFRKVLEELETKYDLR